MTERKQVNFCKKRAKLRVGEKDFISRSLVAKLFGCLYVKGGI